MYMDMYNKVQTPRYVLTLGCVHNLHPGVRGMSRRRQARVLHVSVLVRQSPVTHTHRASWQEGTGPLSIVEMLFLRAAIALSLLLLQPTSVEASSRRWGTIGRRFTTGGVPRSRIGVHCGLSVVCR